MCGIAGIFDPAGRIALDNALVAMSTTMAHRGPDDEGVWRQRLSTGGQVGLASRRLAILDLSEAGHMPMSSPDGSLTITYNGEIYNYPDLRQHLEGKGYVFRSNSDTEAILHLYAEYGLECLRHLNGMFAFGLWDRRKQRMFLARDHFGIKPLYYSTGGVFAFASEAKSLFCIPGTERAVDPVGLDEYLTYLWVPEPNTIFKGIAKVPAGNYLLVTEKTRSLVKYWDYTMPDRDHTFELAPEEIYTELRERFFRAVKAQMLADVPVGAFLSSGLDSSSIVAAMARADPRPVRTFTVAFPARHRLGELTIDDPSVAMRTANRFGCEHSHIVVEPQVANLLPKVVWHMDEPVADPSAILTYLVAQEAHGKVKVLLSGVGGDELLAGYRKHRAHELAGTYQRLPGWLRSGVIEPVAKAMPAFRNTPIKGHVRLAKKMVRSGSLGSQERFITDSIYLNRAQRDELYAQSWTDPMGELQRRSIHLDHFGPVEKADFLNQMLYVDAKTFMVSLPLHINDKMTMATSIEARVPFLDRNLAEWVARNVPPNLKLHGGQGKFVLRQAMRGVLPDEVLRQRKTGFAPPLDHWLANDLRLMVNDLLDDATLTRRGILNPGYVRKLVSEQRSGREDWSLQVWQLLTLELWMREFIDRSPIKDNQTTSLAC